VLYLTFSCAWSAGWFDMSMIRLTAWCAVALAILQTFVLGDDWGGIEQRFTSFTSPQYFAACLVSLLAILVFSGTRGWFHYATCTLIVAAILLSGSRYVFISTILLLIIAAFRVSGDSHSLRFRISTKKMVITLGVAAAVAAALISYLPQNRLDEMFSAASEGDVKVEDVGTLSWRLGIYQEIFERLDRRSFTQLFFGSGTSSGAILMLDRDSYNYEPDGIDANRVLHSEFLRALYEWGIVGMALLLGFLVCTIIAFARKIAADGGGTALAFLGVLPSVVIGLAIENVLAGAASAAGVGILLAMSFAWRAEPEYSVESYQLEGFNSEGRALSA
jgi:O-Antigen ligase